MTINGVNFDPAGGAAVVIFPQINAIASSSARVSVGSVKLANAPRFLLDTRLQGGRIPFGSFALAAGAEALGGFALFGDVKVEAVAQARGSPRTCACRRSCGWAVRPSKPGHAAGHHGSWPDPGLDAHRAAERGAGALAVKRFQIDYDGAASEWRGRGRRRARRTCLDMVPPNGSVVIRDGRLQFAGASLVFPPPGVPLFPGLNMERVGFGLGLDPTRMVGNARLVALKVYQVDGRLLLAFASGSTPYVFNREEVGAGFPPHFYGRGTPRRRSA